MDCCFPIDLIELIVEVVTISNKQVMSNSNKRRKVEEKKSLSVFRNVKQEYNVLQHLIEVLCDDVGTIVFGYIDDPEIFLTVIPFLPLQCNSFWREIWAHIMCPGNILKSIGIMFYEDAKSTAC